MRRLRVLVVEDEFLVADYIASVVEDEGHEVIGLSHSFDHAVASADQLKPDLAILDIRLKGERDGVEVADVLRTSGVRFIFISGSGDPTTLGRAMAREPISFLQKPFKPAALAAALSQALGDRTV